MIFHPTAVAGVFHIEPERLEDERGFFARTFCLEEMAAHGLAPVVSQASVSFNHRRGTVRGLHLQAPPRQEPKLVRCTAGAIFDVAVDLRPDSPTFRRHVAVELSARRGNQLYLPGGVAHGFQTLTDDAEVYYQMAQRYSPEHAGGYRYDDPAFAIPWPEPVTVISERDLALPRFEAGGDE